MKKFLYSIFALSIAFALTGCEQHPQPVATQKKVVLTTLNNQKIKLNNLDGKWLVLNYWATWCKPCYKEIPALNAFAKKYHEKVTVVGVSYDRVEPDQLPALIKKMNIQFVTLKYDPALDLGIDHVPGLPATYIFNPQGKKVKTLLGEQTLNSLEKAIG